MQYESDQGTDAETVVDAGSTSELVEAFRHWVGDGIVVWKNTPLQWYGGRWHARDGGWLRRTVFRFLGSAKMKRAKGPPVSLKYDCGVAESVYETLVSQVWVPYEQLPAWTGDPEGAPVVERCVATRDQLVWLDEGGNLVCAPRTRDWLCPFTCPVDLDLEATCPVWEETVAQWSNGDEAWVRTLRKTMAYILVADRSPAVWFLAYGKVRAGKGVWVRTMDALLGNSGAFWATSLDRLGARFLGPGIEMARAIVVNEVNEPSRQEGERVVAFVKGVVGNDPVVVERKYRDPDTVRLRAAPLLVSNEVPVLPDKAMGLSSKMVLIPFTESFLGREDRDLERKLAKELPGILVWVLRGLQELQEDGWRWTPLERAQYVRSELEDLWRPYEGFLEDRFVRDPTYRAANAVIWEAWRAWCSQRSMDPGPAQTFPRRLREGSTWDLRPWRHGQSRGLKGLRPRSEEV